MIQNSDLEKISHDYLTLKKIRRTGWQLRGIRDAESLADHSFGVVLMTLLLAEHMESFAIDRDKAVAIAIVHELGEARVGDIPFTALTYFPAKSETEIRAVDDILEPLGKTKTEFSSLFREFEEKASTEARFVRAIDKLEMLITAFEYEKAGFTGLSEFWENESTFEALREFPVLLGFANHLKATRPSHIKKGT